MISGLEPSWTALVARVVATAKIKPQCSQILEEGVQNERLIAATRSIPLGVLLGVAAGLWFAIGLRLVRPSFVSVMGPVAAWAFGVALIMPGTTTSALAGFPTIAGAAAALTGFLQIGGGLAGSGVAAVFFRDPFVALTSVVPGMAALAALVHFA